jgi:hypothetical protein
VAFSCPFTAPSVASAQSILAHPYDGEHTENGSWINWDGPTSLRIGVGVESFLPGRNAVISFQLPDLGPVVAPFTSAVLNVFLESVTSVDGFAFNVDLYAFPPRSGGIPVPVLGTLVYYEDNPPDPNPSMTLLQDDLIIGGDAAALGPKSTSASGSAALVNFMNEQYAGGASAGEFIFLRLNPDADNGSVVEGYNLTSTEGLIASNRPTISYTFGDFDMGTLAVLPDSCSSSTISTRRRGSLPVAILGSSAFDVQSVDFSSLLLEGVAPNRFSIEDVSSPMPPACQISASIKDHGTLATAPQGVGQSFTACRDGMVESILVDVDILDDPNARIEIQVDSDTWSGSYGQNVVLAPGENLIQLEVPFPVVEGVVYAFGFFPSTGRLSLWKNGDSYAGGEDFFIVNSSKLRTTPSGDMFFTVNLKGPESNLQCECTTGAPDGIPDLLLKFSSEEVLAALGTVSDGEIRNLALVGTLLDGTRVTWTDCVQFRSKGKKPVLDGQLQVSPNPFNPATSISFVVEKPQRVRIGVYDVRGRLVAELANGLYPAGPHAVEWRGRDTAGRTMPSGTYFFRVDLGGEVAVRKAMLMK